MGNAANGGSGAADAAGGAGASSGSAAAGGGGASAASFPGGPFSAFFPAAASPGSGSEPPGVVPSLYDALCAEIDARMPVTQIHSFANPSQVEGWRRRGAVGGPACPPPPAPAQRAPPVCWRSPERRRAAAGGPGPGAAAGGAAAGSGAECEPGVRAAADATFLASPSAFGGRKFSPRNGDAKNVASPAAGGQRSGGGDTLYSASDADYSLPVYGSLRNHFSFLEPAIFDAVLPFIFDRSLARCLAVCPHWFRTIYAHLSRRCAKIAADFASICCDAKMLSFAGCGLSIQPLFTAEADAARVDLLLYATVAPGAANQCVQLSYKYRYGQSSGEGGAASAGAGSRLKSAASSGGGDVAGGFSRPLSGARSAAPGAIGGGAVPGGFFPRTRIVATADDPLISARFSDPEDVEGGAGLYGDRRRLINSAVLPPPESSFEPAVNGLARVFEAFFRFEGRRRGARRRLWLQRDTASFHGDELMIAAGPNVATACAGDVVEVPVPLANAFGAVDAASVVWERPAAVPEPFRAYGQRSEHERPGTTWLPISKYVSAEEGKSHDIFRPQWRLASTDCSGPDAAVTRSVFRAAAAGAVPGSRAALGLDCVVRPAGAAALCPLPRLGLQHDRFSRLETRVGDTVVLYVSSGGSA